MRAAGRDSVAAPAPPVRRLQLGVTGHRASHPAYAARIGAVCGLLDRLFDDIDQADADVCLLSLLASGIDQVAAERAVARGWSVVAPLPFGHRLNAAINAGATTADAARAILAGRPVPDPAVAAEVAALATAMARAHVFALAERDEPIGDLLLRHLAEPDNAELAGSFQARLSERVALAARVMLEQADLLVAVWDGVTEARVGGTGHTLAAALERGTPVLWIDIAEPESWRLLTASEQLAAPRLVPCEGRDARLAGLVRGALVPGGGADARDAKAALARLSAERWRPSSERIWHGYRRIEALFGGDPRPFRSLVQRYEQPESIAGGSGAGLLAAARALPGGDPAIPDRIEAEVLRRFAFADGVSSWLSDCYRGGMTASFLLAALAVVTGLSYQVLADERSKWIFAGGEFLLIALVLAITGIGVRRRWHRRWFETRRLAEYLRHAPPMLLLGVARPPGRWPRGERTQWPEHLARQSLRAVGLPRLSVTPAYVRGALALLLEQHVLPQRDYHRRKARRLATAQHRLDRLSVIAFFLAFFAVSAFLVWTATVALGLFPPEPLARSVKPFTFAGVAFPVIGSAIAGIRYFGDFERFAALSDVAAEKLDAIAVRIGLLLRAPDGALDYGRAADLVHAVDSVVVDEIEGWQSVFGGKHISVPV